MNRPILAIIAGLAGSATLCLSLALQAADPDQATRERIRKALPGVGAADIHKTEVPGLYEVNVGTEFGYVTGDGKYLIQGDLVNLESGESVTEKRRKGMRLSILKDVGEAKMITFPAKKPRHTVTVFTDIDCGYCRKLHREIRDYNDRGITVRYMMYPRSGPQTESFFKAISVWCANDRRDAMTRAKAGEQVPRAQCKNPVLDHYRTGQRLGVRGTPMIVTDDGAVIPGYVPAAQLLVRLTSED